MSEGHEDTPRTRSKTSPARCIFQRRGKSASPDHVDRGEGIIGLHSFKTVKLIKPSIEVQKITVEDASNSEGSDDDEYLSKDDASEEIF